MLFEDCLKLLKKKSKDGIQVNKCWLGPSYVWDIVQNSEKNTRENIPQTTGEMDWFIVIIMDINLTALLTCSPWNYSPCPKYNTIFNFVSDQREFKFIYFFK